jgi:hypothetical protein
MLLLVATVLPNVNLYVGDHVLAIIVARGKSEPKRKKNKAMR